MNDKIKYPILNLHEKIKIYKNNHKNLYSIVKNNKVIGYTDKITLKNVKFIVNEQGRQNVLKTKNKNVHAYIEGYFLGYYSINYPYSLYYNPYKCNSFKIDNRQVNKAYYVSLNLEKNTAT